ncbi:MAG: Crp/Fnr family transcriptional regulator [Verrucomicrobiales bacterium]|nr:Crp/Fnr family transcriptional regulator [Verrucomicrobiales bacterium]
MIKPPRTPSLAETRKILDILRATQLFSELGEADLRNIVLCSETRSLPKRTFLFHEGDSPAGFFVVARGAVNVHRLDEEGRETVIRVFREGESFGELFLVDEGPSPVSARAESATSLLLVRRRDLSSMIALRPEIAMRLLASMSRHLRSLVDKIGSLQHRTVGERLREWLLARCSGDESPAVIALPPRKYLLAAEIGTIPETLSRTLTKFRERGWILTAGDNITVLSPRDFAAASLDGTSA